MPGSESWAGCCWPPPRRHGWSSPRIPPSGHPRTRTLCLPPCRGCGNPMVSSPPSSVAWPSAASPITATRTACGSSKKAVTSSSLVVWFAFGAVMLVPGFEDGWRRCCLCLIGPHPAADDSGRDRLLTGSGLDRANGVRRLVRSTWLASVVFGLIAADALALDQSRLVLAAVTVTVAASVLLHGVTKSHWLLASVRTFPRKSSTDSGRPGRTASACRPHAQPLAPPLERCR